MTALGRSLTRCRARHVSCLSELWRTPPLERLPASVTKADEAAPSDTARDPEPTSCVNGPEKQDRDVPEDVVGDSMGERCSKEPDRSTERVGIEMALEPHLVRVFSLLTLYLP